MLQFSRRLGPLAIPQKVRVVKEKKAKEAKTVSKETKTVRLIRACLR